MGDIAVFMTRIIQERDERGSLIVVLAVIFVLTLLCSTIGFEVFGNQENVLAKSRSAASISAADAGLADALFRLDQVSPMTASAFCMDSTGTGVIGSATCVQAQANLNGVSYIAVPSEDGTVWSIKAKALVNTIWGAVQETASYSALYPFAVFGTSGLDFNGQNPNTVGAYSDTSTSSSTNPDSSSADCTGGVGTSCVQVGSNGPIKCAGGLGGNVSEVYYTGGGGASQCANPVPNGSKYTGVSPPTAPTSGSPLTCPGLATTDSFGDAINELGSGYAGAPSSIGAVGTTSTYYCQNTAIAISGNLSVQGTVLLYIILDPSTDNTFINNGLQTLYIAGGSEVNTTFDGTTGPPPSGTTLPVAQALQILSNSTGTVGNANGGGTSGPYTFGGVLYAPEANLVGNGCKSAYYGSLTINTLTCNGGPHLQVYYDTALKDVLGPPAISGYSQINPSSVSIP